MTHIRKLTSPASLYGLSTEPTSPVLNTHLSASEARLIASNISDAYSNPTNHFLLLKYHIHNEHAFSICTTFDIVMATLRSTHSKKQDIESAAYQIQALLIALQLSIKTAKKYLLLFNDTIHGAPSTSHYFYIKMISSQTLSIIGSAI